MDVNNGMSIFFSETLEHTTDLALFLISAVITWCRLSVEMNGLKRTGDKLKKGITLTNLSNGENEVIGFATSRNQDFDDTFCPYLFKKH